jgi:hypothetical protein
MRRIERLLRRKGRILLLLATSQESRFFFIPTSMGAPTQGKISLSSALQVEALRCWSL